MNILFVINPVAGGIDKKPFLQEAKNLCRYYGIGYKVYETTGKDDGKALLKTASKYQPGKVVAVGGDGTLLMAGAALKDLSIPIGLVPMGSANGMANELMIEDVPIEAFTDILLSQHVEYLDLLVVNQKHYCMHIGDIGLNAFIVDAYEKDPNRGMLTYAKYFLQALKEQEPFEFSLKAGKKEQSGEAVMLGICNARKFGTGVPLNSISNPFDGKFEIVIIKEVNTRMIVQAGLSVFDETFSEHHTSEVIATEEVHISFPKEQLLQLDGEVVGKYRELNIQIEAQVIPLITHGGNPYVR